VRAEKQAHLQDTAPCLVSPPGLRQGGDGDAHRLSKECLVCLTASCWGMLTSSGTELENLEQEGNAAQVLSQP